MKKLQDKNRLFGAIALEPVTRVLVLNKLLTALLPLLNNPKNAVLRTCHN